MLGQLQDAGNTTTLSHYLDLLNTAGLLTGLPKYYKEKGVQQKNSSPKLQVYNTALMTAQSTKSVEAIRTDPALWGHWVESTVGSHLLNAAWKEDFRVLYWRQENDEVDFVLQRGEELVALEVKSTAKRSKAGMDAFREQFKPDKTYLVGQSGLPWEDLLAMPAEKLFG
jgi:predicted AAA+ superfamily ATPase